MKIRAFTPMHRGTLRGFCDVQLENGMILLGCSVHEGAGKRWANPPARLMIGPDRRPLLDDRGRPRYEPAVDWTTRGGRWAWSQAVVTALDEHIAKRPLEGGRDERRAAADTPGTGSEAGE